MAFEIPVSGLVFDPVTAMTILKPLLMFIGAIVIYAVFVYNFYKFMGTKNIFELNLTKYNTSIVPGISKLFHILLYLLEHVIVLPVIIFFWFAIMTTIILMLTEAQDASSVALISMALVGSVRITAYYHEDLSKDLAKLLPYALLGVFLGEIKVLSFSNILTTLTDMLSLAHVIIYYLAFIISLEIILRFSHFLFGNKEKDKKKSSADDE